jgi:hypothetical protein
MPHASRMRLLALGALASLAAMPAFAQNASPSPAQPSARWMARPA